MPQDLYSYSLEQVDELFIDDQISAREADRYFYFWRNSASRLSSECESWTDHELDGPPTDTSYRAWRARQ